MHSERSENVDVDVRHCVQLGEKYPIPMFHRHNNYIYLFIIKI